MAPSLPLLGVPSSSIIVSVERTLLGGARALQRRGDLPVDVGDRLETPLPAQASPPSRSSTASNSPVEAPEGTAARPARAGVEGDLDLDRRVAARVEDLARVNGGDGAHGMRQSSYSERGG